MNGGTCGRPPDFSDHCSEAWMTCLQIPPLSPNPKLKNAQVFPLFSTKLDREGTSTNQREFNCGAEVRL